MTILESLYSTLDGFRSYAPFVDSNATFKELNSSAASAQKQICIIISTAVFDKIKVEPSSKKEALLTAMANLTLSKQLVFDVITQRKSDVDIYKYELEAMRRSYIDNYYNGMDTLIQLLDEDTAETGWRSSKYYTIALGLRIKTTDAFDTLYPIDLSYLYFFRTIPLQAEILDERMNDSFDKASGNESATSVLLRALAKMTVSLSLRRFDVLEFPPTIRNLFDDSKISRNGADEQKQMLNLSAGLKNEADVLIQSVDNILSNSETLAVDTQTDFNLPSDNIFLMP